MRLFLLYNPSTGFCHLCLLLLTEWFWGETSSEASAGPEDTGGRKEATQTFYPWKEHHQAKNWELFSPQGLNSPYLSVCPQTPFLKGFYNLEGQKAGDGQNDVRRQSNRVSSVSGLPTGAVLCAHLLLLVLTKKCEQIHPSSALWGIGVLTRLSWAVSFFKNYFFLIEV